MWRSHRPRRPALTALFEPLRAGYLWFEIWNSAHLTTNDGLSQEHGSAILQDRRAFTWHATGDWLATLDDGLDTGTVYTTSRRRFW